MGNINSRAKGARLERYFADLINLYFPGAKARRGQQYSGVEGEDIVHQIDGIHFESKGVERLNAYEAMEQAERDAKEDTPVVLWKRNNRKPMVFMNLEDLPTAIHFFATFLGYKHEPVPEAPTLPKVSKQG